MFGLPMRQVSVLAFPITPIAPDICVCARQMLSRGLMSGLIGNPGGSLYPGTCRGSDLLEEFITKLCICCCNNCLHHSCLEYGHHLLHGVSSLQ